MDRMVPGSGPELGILGTARVYGSVTEDPPMLQTIVAALLLASPAYAQDAPKEAPKVAEKASASTPDEKYTAAIVETIKMTTAGQLDQWMDKYCDPERCKHEQTRDKMKRYSLASAQKWSGACLHEGDTIKVQQTRGQVTDPDGAMWYLTCEGRQIGVGVRGRYDADADRIWFSQLGF